jgi:uncharacterized RDD family membrane protein YckC
MSETGDPIQRAYGRPASIGRLGPVEILDTPERVRLDLEIAGPMSRAFAFSIDYSLILVLMMAGLLLLVSGSQQLIDWFSQFTLAQDLLERVADWLDLSSEDQGNALLRGLALTIGIWLMLDLFVTTTYFLIFETLFRGRTPGKRLTHLRVVSEDGRMLDWRQSLLRNLLRMVDSLPAGYLVGVVAMLISPRLQRLGDLVAGTIVIREREDFLSDVMADVMADVVIAPDVEAAFRFTGEELNLIGEVERRLIRRTLRRAESLSDRAAGPILDRATQAISRRIGRADPIASQQQRDFLLALLQASELLT